MLINYIKLNSYLDIVVEDGLPPRDPLRLVPDCQVLCKGLWALSHARRERVPDVHHHVAGGSSRVQGS